MSVSRTRSSVAEIHGNSDTAARITDSVRHEQTGLRAPALRSRQKCHARAPMHRKAHTKFRIVSTLFTLYLCMAPLDRTGA